MTTPLLISSILRHAATFHAGTEIVSQTVEGPVHRYAYADLSRRSQKLAHALQRLGLEPGDRVATLACNGYRHLELYYGVSGSGLVCHTINPRLFRDQISYIIGHAQDRVLFADLTFLPLLESLAPDLAGLKAVVILTDAAHMPRSAVLPDLICYEDLIAGEPDSFDWPVFDENTASSLCYTSGTTGHPKGVVYSHRSSVLHAMAASLMDVFRLSASDAVLPAVPMFHVNAWGLPYAAPMVGAKLVLPGPRLDGPSLNALMRAEGVTMTAGVPTIWLNLLDAIDASGDRPEALRQVVIGGSAAPPVMITRFQNLGIEARHAWGMTETSPVGLSGALLPKHDALSDDARLAMRAKQGRPLFGMEVRVKREGQNAFGAMQVRGPWVTAGYYSTDPGPSHTPDGWFDTGDVVTMDEDGYIQIVDRTKDVIKSGGEWISSIALENMAQAHEAVQEVAAVAVPDAKWGERPVLVVVPRPGKTFGKADLDGIYADRVPHWCIPDDVILVDELPHTATGKLLKSAIRDIALARRG